MKVSIYALIDPSTKIVRYVGQTQRPVPVRVANHVVDAWSSDRDLKSAWLVDLARQNLLPEFQVLEVCEVESLGAALLIEQKWIDYYHALCPLLNTNKVHRARVNAPRGVDTARVVNNKDPRNGLKRVWHKTPAQKKSKRERLKRAEVIRQQQQKRKEQEDWMKEVRDLHNH